MPGKKNNANTGRKLSKEHKKKISKSLTGRKHSEESKRKMSEARKGKKRNHKGPGGRKGQKNSKEHNEKVSASLTGREISEETKQKMSESRKGKKHSEETKAKMSKKGGGYRGWRNSNRGVKWYEVEMPDGTTQKVQGTYELRYALYLLENGIEFTTQPRPGLQYTDQFGGTRTYNPDFWVPSLDRYIEIKSTYTLSQRGAKKKLDLVKKAGHNVEILTEVELEELGVDMKCKLPEQYA